MPGAKCEFELLAFHWPLRFPRLAKFHPLLDAPRDAPYFDFFSCAYIKFIFESNVSNVPVSSLFIVTEFVGIVPGVSAGFATE